MRYSIFILLFFIYALLTVIAVYVARMMRRESRALMAGASRGGSTERQAGVAAVLPTPSEASRTPELPPRA
jgi:hypothetical protein